MDVVELVSQPIPSLEEEESVPRPIDHLQEAFIRISSNQWMGTRLP